MFIQAVQCLHSGNTEFQVLCKISSNFNPFKKMSERKFSTFHFCSKNLCSLEKCQALLLCFAPSLKVGFLLGEIVIKRSTVAFGFLRLFSISRRWETSKDERKVSGFCKHINLNLISLSNSNMWLFNDN